MISLNKSDHNFKNELSYKYDEKNIKACSLCGICNNCCPISKQNNDYDPRQIIYLILLGQKQKILSSPLIWLCSSCYTCQDNCPQKVCLTDIFIDIKNLAFKLDYAPSSIKKIENFLKKFNKILTISNFENEKRLKLKLPLLEIDEID